ncbi:hypothetical protein [Luteolibacter soli]|uniref:Uncharacterized protein n=1 Tax=Luteolibacter soli TaxID=3135280 RepID=A0ABU9B1I5_9BACT
MPANADPVTLLAMRRVVAIVAGIFAVVCMVASNINSSDSNGRLHSLGRAGVSLGRAELAVEQLPETASSLEADATKNRHVEALDSYKEAFISADLRIGGAKLLGNASLAFLAVAFAAAVRK